MFGKERKCFRKGGRKRLEQPYFPEAPEPSFVANKRAKQFAMFAALRGFEEMLEAAKCETEEKHADK